MKYLVCVDGSAEARKALSKAITMVSTEDSMYFLNVYPPLPSENGICPSSNCTLTKMVIEMFSGVPDLVDEDDPIKQQKKSNKKKSLALKEFNFIKSQQINEKCNVHYLLVASPDISDTITKIAEHYCVDAIVMGCRGLGLQKLLIGSISSQVLQMSNCSVLIVR
ncbi:hypothetical protein DLAC_05412 [Tieghemostelium lacteum]|uniref:UspA domain-containing protein n=1 Tax=Tieghemostelium lacteum TaxID=361077 RepID=A0A151ZFX4_TIELA|nr:hypothetical protein DLAC_05412 [Tieghemostelium lacteum]|eukprot:KYQ92827.1 hypothetical protein DLAC_05412 [Tieghemostelium lacteum]